MPCGGSVHIGCVRLFVCRKSAGSQYGVSSVVVCVSRTSLVGCKSLRPSVLCRKPGIKRMLRQREQSSSELKLAMPDHHAKLQLIHVARLYLVC